MANEDGEEIYRLKPGVGKSEAEIRTLLTPEQVSASQSMHQTWTALQHDGPNHLELQLWTALQHDGPNHLELLGFTSGPSRRSCGS